MGIPLSAVISPLVFAAAIIGMDLVNVATPIADPFKNYNGDSGAILTAAQYVALGAALLLPGAIVLVLAWLGVRRLFRRSAAGSGVLLLGARDPRPHDREEHQLANLVEEMAIAAGIPPPTFKLIDSVVPNAGVVGTSMEDATLIVTTGLLVALDRDETQAVVGQLVGAAGNGDLRIGTTLISVFVTFGAVSSFLGVPADRAARRSARGLLRLVFRRRHDPAFEARLLEDLVADKQDMVDVKSGCLSVILVPFVMAHGAFTLNRLIFQPFLVNPFLKRRWQARRYLADASAVELTRNPTALAGALTKLGPLQADVPGAEWMSHLFFVGGGDKTAQGIADLHAPIPKRLERLVRLGAEMELPAEPVRRARLRDVKLGQLLSTKMGCLALLVLVVAVPFLILVVPIMWACALALTGISLGIDMMFLAPMVAIIHLALRSVGRG